MDKRNVTLLLVNNESGTTKKFVFSLVSLKVVLFSAAVVTLIFVAGMIDYVGLMFQAMENKRLENENVLLKKQFQVVEGKLGSLENSLERVKIFTNKLKLITNINMEDRVTKLTMTPKPAANQPGPSANAGGPGQATEEYEPMDQRASNEKLASQDKDFPPEQKANEMKAEVAAQPSSQDYGTLVIRIDKAVKETQLKEQSVIELWESLSERLSLLNSTPNIKPARGWLTSRFGYRLNPFTNKMQLHAGLDIAAAPGSPVVAPADGVVIFASYDETYGKLVSIDHGYGVTTRFAHNSQIYVRVGQKVSKYDVISAVGNTGRSTGPHCHYEVRVNGVPVDPINYVLDE
jgi:murein DD-endopeptidase MepM/ murein hydrolase activator NlpD